MWIVLTLIVLGALAIIFLPQFKGWRTQIFNAAVGIIGAAIPFLTQITDSLKDLDWRTYILAGDKKNLTVLGVLAAFAVIGAVLRYKTTGAVGEK